MTSCAIDYAGDFGPLSPIEFCNFSWSSSRGTCIGSSLKGSKKRFYVCWRTVILEVSEFSQQKLLENKGEL